MKIAVIGLGYVGLPILKAFSKKYCVAGIDSDKQKIDNYIKLQQDECNENFNSNIKFSTSFDILSNFDIIIVTVPTPIDDNKKPDLTCLRNATKSLAKYMKKGSLVIYESTVFPGTTEEICVPILEKTSNMICGEDFFVGYSPERINVGDKVHTFENIDKIVAGIDKKTSSIMKEIYGSVLNAKVVEVSSIKVAEASKIIENSQRDINIAFINEISKIFKLMNIDTYEVLEAASTKWNFLNFKPGLVGGHCIGVDPYYLAQKAIDLNYVPEVILSGRNINDSMGIYVAESLLKIFKKNKIMPKNKKILVLGVTFKEDISDIRNSRVVDIINYLEKNGCTVYAEDYNVDDKDFFDMYNKKLYNNVKNVDAVIIATKHKDYCNFTIEEIKSFYSENSKPKIFFDLYGIYDLKKLENEGIIVWRF